MLNALQTIHTIRPATTDMSIRLSFTLFVRGSLYEQGDVLQDLLQRLGNGFGSGRPHFLRSGGRPLWVPLPEAAPATVFAELVGSSRSGSLFELAERRESECNGAGAWWQFADLPSVRGIERASYVRGLLPSGTTAGALAALGEWVIDHSRLYNADYPDEGATALHSPTRKREGSYSAGMECAGKFGGGQVKRRHSIETTRKGKERKVLARAWYAKYGYPAPGGLT